MDKNRYLSNIIEKNLQKKMVLLAGPRQCGKTTLGKNLLQKPNFEGGIYLNWDYDEDRELILKSKIPIHKPFIIFDEIHKYVRWRQVLKGIFDKFHHETKILVTGSAKLDYYRKGGDSLQGRYRFFRMHPFSYKELAQSDRDQLIIDRLMHQSGFPEPYLSEDLIDVKIWSRDYRTRLIREELTDLERVSELSLLEKLNLRLPELVGSPLSINSLREDLQVSHQTVSRWIELLERLYALFRIYPMSSKRVRAVKKEAKHYYFDWTTIEETGYRFENLIACHLLKWVQYQEDVMGEDVELRYFRDTDKREVDFVVTKNQKPILLVEAKASDETSSPHLRYLYQKYPETRAVQVLLKPNIHFKDKFGIEVVSAHHFLWEFI